MSEAFVLVNCVEMLADIYGYDLTIEDSKTDVFNKPGLNGKGCDKGYFEYIRSLCSAHPERTSGFIGVYQSPGGESCPYVLWNNYTSEKDGDLIARVYCNDKDLSTKMIKIYIDQVFEYVKKRYNLIAEIQKKVVEYNESEKERYRLIKLKSKDDFEDYVDYLNYLKDEIEKRSAKTGYDELDFVKMVIGVTFSDPINREIHKKYCSALKYAVRLEHQRIQTLSPIDPINGTLLNQLIYVNSGSKERMQHSYTISKLEYLLNPSRDQQDYARDLILAEAAYFGKYINLEDCIDSEELYVLVHAGMYFDCLNSECFVNNNIPKDSDYR